MKKLTILLLSASWLLLSVQAASAQSENNPGQSHTRFDEHTVYYSVFNSTMVQPEVAQLHSLTRADDQVLVNIAVVPNGEATGGQPAEISGNATNLMQQQSVLPFKEIVEGQVTYYLAPLRINDDEVIHFHIQVNPEGDGGPYQVRFSRRLYVDR